MKIKWDLDKEVLNAELNINLNINRAYACITEILTLPETALTTRHV